MNLSKSSVTLTAAESIVWLNGQWLPHSQATIPIDDRGWLFGDGLFTTIKVQDGRLFLASSHLQRLHRQCQHINIIAPTIELSSLQQLVAINQATRGLWRIKIIISAAASTALSTPLRSAGTVLMTIAPASAAPKSVALTIYPQPLHRPLSHLKSLAYLDRLMVRQYAIEQQYDDAITLCSSGNYLESSFANIFWLDSNTLYTPAPSLPLLRGICLAAVEQAAADLGCKICYVFWKGGKALQLPCFCCNSLWGIVPVVRIMDHLLPIDELLSSQLQVAMDAQRPYES